jgi:hypothetical protein
MLQHKPQKMRTRQAASFTLFASAIFIGKTHIVIFSAQNVLLEDELNARQR